ncbi:hypothetical protein [Muriicola sp.]|uniref:hypothetical protein n=1 Tax=Muriicola sp. TaxID=2020856 RepID=UPI003C75CC4A
MIFKKVTKVFIQQVCVCSIVMLCCLCCATTNRFTQGKVVPSGFYGKTTFTTVKSLIILPCELNGERKNFLFDTGAQVTGIHRDSIFGEIVTVRGGSNRTIENGSEIVASLKIGGVDFINTFATNDNMTELHEKIPNFGGVLGRTVMDKSNWLINYPGKTIEISNEDLSDETYTDIPLLESSSTPYTYIDIDNKRYKAIIDLGSTSVLNVPENTELAKFLIERYQFSENRRERYTVGGTQNITELVGSVPLLKIDSAEFKNIEVNINQSSQIRLGMAFFTDYMIYIDNKNHRYRIKRIE